MRLFNFSFNFRYFGNSSPPKFCSCLIYQAQLPPIYPGQQSLKAMLRLLPEPVLSAVKLRFFAAPSLRSGLRLRVTKSEGLAMAVRVAKPPPLQLVLYLAFPSS